MPAEQSKQRTGGKPKGMPKYGGRKKGTPNKTTALLKDAILMAAEQAGDKEGIVGYLKTQARDNPGPFMSLLGKVMPMQVEGTGDDGQFVVHVTRRIVDANRD